MRVTLESRTIDPALTCGKGAAMCYKGKDPARSLEVAMEGGHESVMEHASFTFRVEGVSRALLAQLTRHRIASFSVESQRYVSYEKGFAYVTPPKIKALGEEAVKRYNNQMEDMSRWYANWLQVLGPGGAEDARFVLPNACQTSLMVTMNARELRHFFSLRLCSRAQWEIRELAARMLDLVQEVAPELFEDAGPCCEQHGYCPEGEKGCGAYPTMDELLRGWVNARRNHLG